MKNIKNLIIVCFSTIWIIALLFDYWNKHILHQQAFDFFAYPIFTCVWAAVTLGLAVLHHRKIPEKLTWLNNGSFLLPLFIIVCLGIFIANTSYANLEVTFGLIFKVLGKIIGYLLSLIFVWLSVYSLGNMISRLTKVNVIKGKSFTVDLVIGLATYTLILFILGLLHMLYFPVIVGLLILPLALNYKQGIIWGKTIRHNQILSPVNGFGVVLISILILILGINFLADLAPFPSGFDSRNYYMNVTKLIADSNGLVRGYQPYPWQLFMSQGHLLGGGSTLAMLLSFSTVFFVCIGIMEICRDYLNLSTNLSLLAIVLFATVPAVQNHMFIELKVDFGLLLVQMATIIFILDRIKLHQGGKGISARDIIILGLITGFGASIKVLNFYMLFAILVALWSLRHGYKGFIATFFLSIGAILIAKFDAVSGMNQYHLSINVVKYVSIGVGLLSLGMLFLSEKTGLLKSIKASVLYLTIIVATLSPWLVKNYIETRSLDPNTLLRGANPSPKINMNLIKENYKPK